MNPAISLADPLFEAAEQLARQLGKSRGQLCAEALREYLERRRDDDITRRLNEVYDAEPELAMLDPVLDALQLGGLRKEKWPVNRGGIWWARLPEPSGSEPGFHRPIVIMQSDRFNHSRISTIIAAAVTG